MTPSGIRQPGPTWMMMGNSNPACMVRLVPIALDSRSTTLVDKEGIALLTPRSLSGYTILLGIAWQRRCLQDNMRLHPRSSVSNEHVRGRFSNRSGIRYGSSLTHSRKDDRRDMSSTIRSPSLGCMSLVSKATWYCCPRGCIVQVVQRTVAGWQPTQCNSTLPRMAHLDSRSRLPNSTVPVGMECNPMTIPRLSCCGMILGHKPSGVTIQRLHSTQQAQ